MDTSEASIASFRDIILSAYDSDKRIFPWRDKLAPWGILVSEFMLQQTQASRVIPFWNRWMDKWPGPAGVDSASLEEVLREWSGLGYNRRAKYLKACAGIIAKNMNGKVPDTPGELAVLPGIGNYTAGAIACFAYNYPCCFIETNIRSVMLHFFFLGKKDIKDEDILPILELALDRSNPRKWYWALMDYGAALKKSSPNPGRQSAHYHRQSAFPGSFRQIRGSLVRALVSGGKMTADELLNRLDVQTEKKDLYRALEALKSESIVSEESGQYQISG